MNRIKQLVWLYIALFSIVYSSVVYAHTSKTKVQFSTEDNQNIVAWLQIPEGRSKKHPVVILIHQGGSSKDEWVSLPLWQSLLREGYALLAYDIRQHGESSVDKDDMFDLFNNPARSPLDLRAAITFIESHSMLDKDRIGIIGASVGANLAVMASALPQYPIKSIVAMSGKTEAAQNLAGVKTPLQSHHLFVIASENEQSGLRKAWAQSFYQSAREPKKIVIADGGEHGSFILKSNPELNKEIIQWLKKTL